MQRFVFFLILRVVREGRKSLPNSRFLPFPTSRSSAICSHHGGSLNVPRHRWRDLEHLVSGKLWWQWRHCSNDVIIGTSVINKSFVRKVIESNSLPWLPFALPSHPQPTLDLDHSPIVDMIGYPVRAKRTFPVLNSLFSILAGSGTKFNLSEGSLYRVRIVSYTPL